MIDFVKPPNADTTAAADSNEDKKNFVIDVLPFSVLLVQYSSIIIGNDVSPGNYTAVYCHVYECIQKKRKYRIAKDALTVVYFRQMLASSISCAFLLGIAATATPDCSMLHSIAELNDFADDPSHRYAPFCITGTVQALNASLDNYIILSDTNGWIEISNASSYRPVPGEKIAVTGRAHMSAHQEIYIAAQDISHVGMESVSPSVEIPLRDISDEKHHLHTVITEGTVIDTFPDEIDSHNQFLILKDEEDVLPVALHVDPGADPGLESLRDARVRVAGRFLRTVSGSRKFSGPFIYVDDRSHVTVVVPALDDPFAAPPLEKALYRTPREIAKRGKRTVSGEVLAVWGGNQLMVRTSDGRIVNATLAHGQSTPKPGDTVTAAGYPETDLFRVNLSRAMVRAEPRTTVPQRESAITDIKSVFGGNGGPNAIDPASHGRLMRIQGIVQSAPSPNGAGRLLLACGPFKIQVDLGQHSAAAADIALGTKLEVTGRCLLEIDKWTPDDIFPRIRNLVAVIRSPEDLRIIARPPWWTPLRLLVVISILVAALIGVYIWNRILQKLVSQRGRELYREQVAHAIAEFKTDERTRLAVELHDSLSQELAGVACQVAASAKTLNSNPAVARRCIETADKMLNSCRTELRQCLFDLRSDTLDEADFSTAIRRTLDQIDGNAAIKVRFNVPRSRLKDTTAHAILAIVRELTGNAVRHGAATEVQVAGSIEPGRILFSVRDNGSGFDPENCVGPIQGHFGIEGIRNRLEKLNGTLSIDSRPGNGTKAVVAIPLPATKTKEVKTP